MASSLRARCSGDPGPGYCTAAMIGTFLEVSRRIPIPGLSMTSFLTREPTPASPYATATRVPGSVPAAGSSRFRRAERYALASTALVGVLVATAPVLPLAIRDSVLGLALAGWVICIGLCLVAGTGEVVRRGRKAGLALLAIGALGVAVALLLAIQLELIRRVGGRPAFTWIPDWRWALNHAQAIARSGGVNAALDYSGAAIDYHVGPAWLAAAVERILGLGLTDALFGLIPLLCLLSMVLGGAAALRASGAPYLAAFAAVTMALTVPLPHRSPSAIYSLLPTALMTPYSWPFLATDLMLNSFLGLAVGLASLGLAVDARSRAGHAVLSSAGLAALVVIKPQFYVGFAVLAALLGALQLARSHTRDAHAARVLLTAVSSLPLALLLLQLAPADMPYFALPTWAPPASRESFSEPRRASSMLGIVALIVWAALIRRSAAQRRRLTPDLLLAAGVSVGLLATALHFLHFPYRSDFTGQWLKLGFPASIVTAMSGDEALSQSLEAPRLVLVAAGFMLLAIAARQLGRWFEGIFVAGALLAVLAPVPLLVAGFVRPPDDYGVAEDRGLWQALAVIPRDSALLVASDLADPAQSYDRALRASLLTAYGGHQFYVSNLRYVHYTRPDAVTRLRELQQFFGSSWSDWHTAWLRRTGVTHVLIHDRCRPPWDERPGAPLRLIARRDHWRVFAVGPVVAAGPDLPSPPAAGGIRPAYGRVDCLSGAEVGPR